MLDWIAQLIGRYIGVVIGLIILKALGWFGLGAVTWPAIFAIGLAPVVVAALWALIVLLAGLIAIIAIIVDEAKVSRR